MQIFCLTEFLLKASGTSLLTFEQKVIKHRDFFDLEELIYKNILILGSVIFFLKKRITE